MSGSSLPHRPAVLAIRLRPTVERSSTEWEGDYLPTPAASATRLVPIIFGAEVLDQ